MRRQRPRRNERHAIGLGATHYTLSESVDLIEQLLFRRAFATSDAIERRQRQLGTRPDENEVSRIRLRWCQQSLRGLTVGRVDDLHGRSIGGVGQTHRQIADGEIGEHEATHCGHGAGRNNFGDIAACRFHGARLLSICRRVDLAGVRVPQRADHARRNATGQTGLGNRAGDDAAGRDHGPRADRRTRQHGHAASQPCVGANRDRRRLAPGRAEVGVVYDTVRPDADVVAECYPFGGPDRGAVVDVNAIADAYLAAGQSDQLHRAEQARHDQIVADLNPAIVHDIWLADHPGTGTAARHASQIQRRQHRSGQVAIPFASTLGQWQIGVT